MNTNFLSTARACSSRAFTLIELLVVISIIGILSGLVISLAGVASSAKQRKQTEAQVRQIQTAIEDFKGKFGYYPPDNGTNAAQRPINPGTNGLFYELTGVTVSNPNNAATATFTPILDPNNILTSANLTSAFSVNVPGFVNTAPPGQQPLTFLRNLKAGKDYRLVTSGGQSVYVLTPAAQPVKGGLNTWRYDSRSTNRHNKGSFDIWAEVVNKRQTNLVGNW